MVGEQWITKDAGDAEDAKSTKEYNKIGERSTTCIYMHPAECGQAVAETNRAKIVARLKAEGWTNEGGGSHDKFIHSGFAYPVIVPRHRTLSGGVARSIAKAAGWK